MAPGIGEFCKPLRHRPIRPGRHMPPGPEIPRVVCDCGQHIPVRGSLIVLAGQAAWADGAVTS